MDNGIKYKRTRILVGGRTRLIFKEEGKVIEYRD